MTLARNLSLLWSVVTSRGAAWIAMGVISALIWAGIILNVVHYGRMAAVGWIVLVALLMYFISDPTNVVFEKDVQAA